MEEKQINLEYIDKFKRALHQRIIEFTYKKKNGDIRNAHGTTNINLIGQENSPKSIDGKTGPDNQIRYYDTDYNGWRSFLIENFIDWKD